MDKLRILLVEDNTDDEMLGLRAIRKAVSAEVQVARDGLEALRMLDQDARAGCLPDVLLLDLRLPGMDGLEVLRQVRATPELGGIVVIVLTSSEHPKDKQACLELGAKAFLSKPLDPAVFSSLIRFE